MQGLYRVPGSAKEVDRLFAQWASGAMTSLPAGLDPNLVASLLKKAFRDLSLTEPLVPFQFYSRFVDVANLSGDDSAKVFYLHVLLGSLPTRNRFLLGAVLKHLRTVGRHSSVNRMTTYNLSVCWAPNVICAQELTPRAALEAPAVVRVFQLMLEHGERLLLEEAPIGAVGADGALTTVPPVLDAAFVRIESSAPDASGPPLYADLQQPGLIPLRERIEIAHRVDSLKLQCQMGELPNLAPESPQVASQLVLRFLADTPRPLIPADLLPAFLRALSCGGRSGTGRSTPASKPRRPSRDGAGVGDSEASAHRLAISDVSDVRSSPSSALRSAGSQGLLRRASDPRGERWIGATGTAVATSSLLSEPFASSADEMDDAVVDALRSCLESLGKQACNVLGRLCAHLAMISAQRAARLRASTGGAGGTAAARTGVPIAEAFVAAVFRVGSGVCSDLDSDGRASGAASTAGTAGASDAGDAPQPKVLVRLLTYLVTHHSRLFSETWCAIGSRTHLVSYPDRDRRCNLRCKTTAGRRWAACRGGLAISKRF